MQKIIDGVKTKKKELTCPQNSYFFPYQDSNGKIELTQKAWQIELK